MAETRQFEIETQEIDKDHIHLLVKTDPTIAPYEIVHRLKQFSAYNIWHNKHDYIKNGIMVENIIFGLEGTLFLL